MWYNHHMEFISHSEEETFSAARYVAEKCIGNEVILLNGDLGAGKTTFTKGLAKALGIQKTVKSPTFTLMKTYQGGRLTLYHFDLYRIEKEEELEELGFTDYLNAGGVCVIEWNKFSDLSGKIITIDIDYSDSDTRKITVHFGDEKQ